MKRKEIYEYHRLCMITHTILLLVDAACIFLSAGYLASFVAIFSDFSYEEGLAVTAKLGAVLAVQLLCGWIKSRYWIPLKDFGTGKLECTVYRRYLEALPGLDSEGKLSVVCGKDIPECVVFFTEKFPAVLQALAGMTVYSLFLIGKEGGVGVVALLLMLGLVQFLPPFVTEKYLVQNYIRAGQEEEKVHQQLISGVSGILTIKMLNLHGWFLDCYRKRQKEFEKAGERAAGTSSIQSALHSGASLVQQLGFLLVGVLAVSKGLLSLEILIEGYALSASFYRFMARLGSLNVERGICRAAEERIIGMLEEPDKNRMFSDLKMELPGKGVWLVKGENGAGKSTLLAVLGGWRRSSAQILWDGKLTERESRLAGAGWCPQMYLKLTDSFRELVEMIPKEVLDRTRLKSCLEEFDIGSEVTERQMGSLSGGQQKRLMLALAFARKGNLLLLDEPEVSLDRAAVESLKRLLERERRPVLLVTHVSDFDSLAEGTVHVEGGRVHVRTE